MHQNVICRMAHWVNITKVYKMLEEVVYKMHSRTALQIDEELLPAFSASCLLLTSSSFSPQPPHTR